MAKIRVSTMVQIYEIDGEDTPNNKDTELKVLSHWNQDNFLVLQFPRGKKYTVDAEDLQAAIENAVNSGD